jgi:hypothetical protein
MNSLRIFPETNIRAIGYRTNYSKVISYDLKNMWYIHFDPVINSRMVLTLMSSASDYHFSCAGLTN